jgi:hypothetical protein
VAGRREPVAVGVDEVQHAVLGLEQLWRLQASE